MDKNANPFENLPGDILYLIFKELDVYIQQYAVSNPISIWPRRPLEVDNRNVRNFSSTCKRLRSWAEPILFRQIVFEDSEELFDSFYDKTMIKFDQMLKKGSLKELTKLFEFRCYGLTIGIERRKDLWVALARLLSHLSALETIVLDIPGVWRATLGTYPPHLKEALFYQGVAPISKDGQNSLATTTRPRILNRIFSWLAGVSPTLNGRRMRLRGGVVQSFPDTTKTVFPSVTEVALSMDASCWLLAHCPNIQSFISLRSPFSDSALPSFEVVHSYIPSMKRLSLECWAQINTLEALSQKYPGLEELALYPPMRRHLLFVGALSVHLDVPVLLAIPPVLRRFPALRELTLKHIIRSKLFPSNMHGTLSTDMQKMVREMGNMCPTLQVIRLGPYIHHRKDAWVCAEVVASEEYM